MKKTVLSFVMLALLPLYANSAESAPQASQGSQSPAATGDAAAGKAKYDTYCATCHGSAGAGDGAAASALNPKPRNFTDKAAMEGKTDDALKKAIKEGGGAVGLATSMPAWGAMVSDADIDNMVAYIRTMAK